MRGNYPSHPLRVLYYKMLITSKMKKTDTNIVLLSLITGLNVLNIFKDLGVMVNILVIILCLLLIVKIKVK